MDEINFDVVHRLKPKQDRSPRGIVAKFERRKDKNKVLSKAIEKLKNNKQFIVSKTVHAFYLQNCQNCCFLYCSIVPLYTCPIHE
jgi:hypothetical protein